MPNNPTVSILTPSFNKTEYVMDAVASVMNQTMANWEYWLVDNSTDKTTRQKIHQNLPRDPRINYLEFNFTPAQRRDYNVQAYIINQVYPELRGSYIFYLSDDDVIYPTCLEKMVLFLDSSPQAWVCYHSQERLIRVDHHWQPGGGIHVRNFYGAGTVYPCVDCVLDGGQILHRRRCLDQLLPPYFSQDPQDACHCDGMFVQRLADNWTIHPIPDQDVLSAHRVTPISTWFKPPKVICN